MRGCLPIDHLVLRLSSCQSICLSTSLYSLFIFKIMVHCFHCIHVFEENHSSNNIYPIFNKKLQSCSRKSFNDAASERASLRSQDPIAEFRPPLTQNPGYPLLVVKANVVSLSYSQILLRFLKSRKISETF